MDKDNSARSAAAKRAPKKTGGGLALKIGALAKARLIFSMGADGEVSITRLMNGEMRPCGSSRLDYEEQATLLSLSAMAWAPRGLDIKELARRLKRRLPKEWRVRAVMGEGVGPGLKEALAEGLATEAAEISLERFDCDAALFDAAAARREVSAALDSALLSLCESPPPQVELERERAFYGLFKGERRPEAKGCEALRLAFELREIAAASSQGGAPGARPRPRI